MILYPSFAALLDAWSKFTLGLPVEWPLVVRTIDHGCFGTSWYVAWREGVMAN